VNLEVVTFNLDTSPIITDDLDMCASYDRLDENLEVG
jgi:hypothetical protein